MNDNAPRTMWVVVARCGWNARADEQSAIACAKRWNEFVPADAPHRVVCYVPQDSGAAYDRGFADGSAIADTKAALAAVPQGASVPREYQKALLMLYYEHNEPDGSPDQPPFPSFDTWVNSWASKLDAAPREPVKAERGKTMDAECRCPTPRWDEVGPHHLATCPAHAAQEDRP